MMRRYAWLALCIFVAACSSRAQAQRVGSDDLVAAYGQTCTWHVDAWVCWGTVMHHFGNVSGPVETGRPTPLALSERIARGRLALGQSHACALVDSTVKCWGQNWFDQAGGARARDPRGLTEPVPAWRGRVTAVAAGYDFTCAALRDGVECIGGSRYGPSAVRITGMPGSIDRLYFNGAMVCALIDRQLSCFGQNLSNYEHARLSIPGAKDSVFVHRRVDFPPFPGAPSDVVLGGGSVGAGHVCGIVDGAVWCGGDNFAHQTGDESYAKLVKLPDSTMAQRFEFHRVPLPGRASAIAAGGAHSCAIVDGGVWCWGGNLYGESGVAPSTLNSPPHLVAGLAGAERIVAGSDHTCAATADTVWCWGFNLLGELGTTTRETCAVIQGKADVGPPERVRCSHRPVLVALPRAVR